jgi:predicted phosphodiesterase
MKIAVVSDIHSNLEALVSVLDDIKENGVQDIYCLGDIIGYGPNPMEALEICKKFKLNLMGNHDLAVYSKEGIDNFNWIAAMAANWTRRLLQPDSPLEEDKSKSENWEFLSRLKPIKAVGRVLFAHGTCNGNMEYIFKTEDAEPTFAYMAERGLTTCFVGHTHVPCVITEDGEYIAQSEGAVYPRIGVGERLIINVGSVGQPRDKDWRASYVIVEGPEIIYRRVEYDVESTIEKIYEIEELNNFLGDRLRKK